MSNVKPVRIDVTPDKQSITSRTERGSVIGTNGPNAAIWKSHPSVADAGTKVISATAALAAAHAAVSSLEAQLAAGRGLRDTKAAEFDAAYSVYVANAETYAPTPMSVKRLDIGEVRPRTQSRREDHGRPDRLGFHQGAASRGLA